MHWTRSRRDGDDEESLVFPGIHSLPNIKNPLHSRLGSALRSARRASGLTQADVASSALCSLPSVLQAELGLGSSRLFACVARAVGQELTGRSLPTGEVGAGLAGLRLRRGLSRAAVAELAGVSIPSVTAVEAGSNVRLPGLAAIATALAAGLRLSPIGEPPAYWTSAAASSAFEGWSTPPEILENSTVSSAARSPWTRVRHHRTGEAPPFGRAFIYPSGKTAWRTTGTARSTSIRRMAAAWARGRRNAGPPSRAERRSL